MIDEQLHHIFSSDSSLHTLNIRWTVNTHFRCRFFSLQNRQLLFWAEVLCENENLSQYFASFVVKHNMNGRVIMTLRQFFISFYVDEHMVLHILHTTNNKNWKSSFTFSQSPFAHHSVEFFFIYWRLPSDSMPKMRNKNDSRFRTFWHLNVCRSQISHENVLDVENRLRVAAF